MIALVLAAIVASPFGPRAVTEGAQGRNQDRTTIGLPEVPIAIWHTGLNPTIAKQALARPSVSTFQSMAYMADTDRGILFGRGETWIYHFENHTWQRMEPATSPPGDGAVAYRTASSQLVFFGGDVTPDGPSNETWIYDVVANEWTLIMPSNHPSARLGHAMAYDPASDRIILFGGFFFNFTAGVSSIPLNDTWAFDVTTDVWTQLNSANGPPPSHGGLLVHDPTSGLLVHLDDAGTGTWTFDPASQTWTKKQASSQRGPRFVPAFVAYPPSGRLVRHGGLWGVRPSPLLGYDNVEESDAFDDTWVFDPIRDEWMEMSAGGGPLRGAHAGIYHPPSGRVYFFGGVGGCSSPPDDVWTYDPAQNAWTNIDQPGLPSRPEAFRSVGADRQVQLTWAPPSASGSSPVAGYRLYWASSYDQPFELKKTIDVGNVLSFTHTGLRNGLSYYYSVRALNSEVEGEASCGAWSRARAVPSSPQNLSATGVGDVILAWDRPAELGGYEVYYQVYRGTSLDSIVRQASVLATTYRDVNVTPGTTYYYRISAINQIGEGSPSALLSVVAGWITLVAAGGGASTAIAAAAVLVRRRWRTTRDAASTQGSVDSDDSQTSDSELK